MPAAIDIPHTLRDRPFTSAEAFTLGLSPMSLRGKRFRRLYRDVYVCRDIEMTLIRWLQAARLVLPAGAAISHTTALWLYGVEVGTWWPLQFSTDQGAQTRKAGLLLHRRRGTLSRHSRQGLPVLGPDRTFVDCATNLGFVDLVITADWLTHLRVTTLKQLVSYADARHLDGVKRARRALSFARKGAESPKETLIRLMLVFARLPEPECNKGIFDQNGRFLARGDLIYFDWKVLVEYDGWQHERDAKQRQRDRERREQLEAKGWRVIVITSEDLKRKKEIPWRVYGALRDHGYEGAPPHTNAMWSKWFC